MMKTAAPKPPATQPPKEPTGHEITVELTTLRMSQLLELKELLAAHPGTIDTKLLFEQKGAPFATLHLNKGITPSESLEQAVREALKS